MKTINPFSVTWFAESIFECIYIDIVVQSMWGQSLNSLATILSTEQTQSHFPVGAGGWIQVASPATSVRNYYIILDNLPFNLVVSYSKTHYLIF